MALHAMGMKIASALGKLTSAESVDDEAVKSVVQDISRALLEADVNFQLVKVLRDNVLKRVRLEDDGAAYNKAKMVEKAVMEELVRMLDPGKEPFKPKKGKANVIMFVGLQGAGKTTTVAKYAHYYQTRRWKVAMVCADTFRAGAFDQLKQNATRVRVPFYGSYTEPDPVKIAEEGVAQFKRDGYEIIIVDTSGRHMQEAALFEEMEQVAAAVKPSDIVFVMDATIGQAAQAQAKAFRESVAVGSVIISKLDGNAKGGGALSAVAATGSPITFVGSGEHFDDFQAFEASAFVGKLLGRGDMRGLLEEMKDKGIMEESEEIMGRMSKGKFTFRDMHEQFASIMKLGSVSKIMEAIPGMSGMMGSMMPPGVDSSAQFKRFIIIMQSMTKKELDCDVVLDQPRILRIARGAGVHPQQVVQLIQAYKQMEKMIGGMSKAGLLKGGDAAFEAKMKRNPGAVMQQLQRNMDPRMLSQMGGAGGLMDMIKGLAGAGGPAAGGAGRGGGGGGGMPGMPPGFPGLGGAGMAGMAELAKKMMKGAGFG